MTVREPAGKAGRPAAVSGAADIPDDPQPLAEDIKRTRQELGDTVEALAAKLDPKVQLRGTVERMKGRASAAAGEATGKITDKAGATAQQLRHTAAEAARGAREQRVPLAAAAGVSALLAGAWIIWVMRRR